MMMGGGNKTTVISIGVYFLIITTFSFTDAYITGSEDKHWLLHRTKRNADGCAEKYQKVTSGHTACLPRSSSAKESGVNQQDRRVILDMHNTARREVSPTARNMQLMSWDDEIAATAQRWADNCVINHDQGYKRYAFGRFSVGQNLAWGTHLTWQEAIQLWIDERSQFRLGLANNLAAVGHYTQMVWADTVKVGCGYALCDSTHYYVCDYGPGGNLDINNPYKAGTTCGDCPSRCSNGLCDCRGKVCLNGGTIKLDSCQCECKNNLKFFLQPDCALNCTDIEDPWYCTQFQGGCERYSNVPQECPDMCNWCPYAGKGYDDMSGAPVTSSTTFTLFIWTLLSFIWCFV